MKVQVKHHLAAGRLVELLDGETVGGEDRHRRARDRLRHLDEMGEIVGRDVEDGAGRGLGMTSVWPGARGMMSRKAKALSSSKTLCAGNSPRRILAKMLFGS